MATECCRPHHGCGINTFAILHFLKPSIKRVWDFDKHHMQILKKWSADIVSYLTKWKIYVGVDVYRAPKYSIVFFPLIPDVLCCGFAGILAVKGVGKREEGNPIKKLAQLFRNIKKNDMKALSSGSVKPSRYLRGDRYLQEMEKTLFQLKTDVAFQEIFFKPLTASQLSDLTRAQRAQHQFELRRAARGKFAPGGSGTSR